MFSSLKKCLDCYSKFYVVLNLFFLLCAVVNFCMIPQNLIFADSQKIAKLLKSSAETYPKTKYLTGCLPYTPETEAKLAPSIIKIMKPRKSIDRLPSRLINVQYLPVVANQLINNCGAFAPSYYYKTYQESREHGWGHPDINIDPEHVMSAGFTYPLSNNGLDSGANPGFVIDIICRYGIATSDVWPEMVVFNVYPGETAWRNAIPYRAKKQIQIDVSTENGINALKEHLNTGDLAVISSYIYHDTHGMYPGGVGVDSEVIYDHGTEEWDYHAFTIVGYDDNKSYTVGTETYKGAFAAVNSWGTDWGVQLTETSTAGFVWFSYDYIKNKRGAFAGPAFTMEDRINYQPTDFAVIDMGIQSRFYLIMSIFPGSPKTQLAAPLEAFPNFTGTDYFGGRMVLDVTDFKNLDPLCYTIKAEDWSVDGASVPEGTMTGGVTNFTIEKPGGVRIKSIVNKETPMPFEAGKTNMACANPFYEKTVGLDEFSTKSLRAAWCDYNNDGNIDLAASGIMQGSIPMLNIFRNNLALLKPLGELQLTLPEYLLSSLDWADFNNDGLADIAISGQTLADGLQAKILRCVDYTTFTDTGINFPALTYSSLACGDYNNDGKIDLLITGYDSAVQPVIKLYRNDNGESFTDTGIIFPATGRATVSFADMNNDGWLDIAIGGKIYRNNKDSSFAEAITLDSGIDNSYAWADYDNDGLLDLAYSSLDDTRAQEEKIKSFIFHNLGNFIFQDITAAIKPVYWGSLSWGDFDNNGLLDLAECGYPEDFWIGFGKDKVAKIYRQITPGEFADAAFDFYDVCGTVAWGDLDNDGAIDLLLSGHYTGDGNAKTTFYSSQIAKKDGMNAPNHPPAPPSNLRTIWDASADAINLLWDMPNDDKTPKKALGYNVRVGTWTGAVDILSPVSKLSLSGTHPHGLISNEQAGRILKGLQPGRYFWSVQAIDGGLAASEWSREESFIIGSSGRILNGDVNQDGKLDVADIVLAVKMKNGSATPEPNLADMDANGFINTVDVQMIVKLVINGAPNVDLIEIISKEIGAEGGTLISDELGFELDIPAGAFNAKTKIILGADPSSFGYEGSGIIPFSWILKGLPIDFTSPLKIRIKDIRPDKSLTPYATVGIYPIPSLVIDGTYGTIDTPQEGSKAVDGWLEFTIQEPGALSLKEEEEIVKGEEIVESKKITKYCVKKTGAVKAEVESEMAKYDFWYVIHIFDEDQWSYRGGHFNIIGSLDIKDALPQIALDMEKAYDFYTEKLGFVLDRRDWTKYPLVVNVKDMGVGKTGEPKEGECCAGMSYDGISISLNKRNIGKMDKMKISGAHEFFHACQLLYNSDNRLWRMFDVSDTWINEATATFLEQYFADLGAEHNPDIISASRQMLLQGFYFAQQTYRVAVGSQNVRSYGYACAAVVKNMVMRNNNDPKIIHSIYQKIREGADGLSAVYKSSTDYPLTNMWFITTFDNIARDKLYPAYYSIIPWMQSDIIPDEGKWTIKDLDSKGHRFPEKSLYNMAVDYYMIYYKDIPKLNITPADKLGFIIKSDFPQDISLSVFNYGTPPNIVYNHLGYGYMDNAKDIKRLDVPNAIEYVKNRTCLVPIVLNIQLVPSYITPTRTSQLCFGIYQDYDKQDIIEKTINYATVSYFGQNLGWPIINYSGKWTAKDVTKVREAYKEAGAANAIPSIMLNVWNDLMDPTELELDFKLASDSVQIDVSDPIDQKPVKVICTYIGPTEYRLKKYRTKTIGAFNMKFEMVEEGPWQDVSIFTIPYEEGADGIAYFVDVKFKYNLKAWKDGALIMNSDADRSFSGFNFYMFLN